MTEALDVLLQRARAFLAEDPDPDTRAELDRLLSAAEGGDAAARADLEDRFGPPLAFGTAGLRGRVEAGTSRMNRVVVMKATWGLGTYLLEAGARYGIDARRQGVVIGFDGRYSSRAFAEDAAAVLGGLGVPVRVFDDPVPTPLLAFAVGHLGSSAGIMVTASHNPPADNGYKVYWSNAAQIVPPHDAGIAACIARAPAASSIARLHAPDAVQASLRAPAGDDVAAAYLDGVAAAALHPPEGPPLRIVYTAMHGVGHRLAVRALRRAGFEGVVAVPSQADPDGAFRTVLFPNPEEKGALDRAYLVADEVSADLVVANDPDADRLAVAVKVEGAWRMLSGNDVGVLLAADAIERADVGDRKKLVVTTVVSSTMLSRMARDLGAAYEETLTGFKWIANAALEAEPRGVAFVFGYEEALGYSVGPLVRDKDGIGAVVRLCELARSLAARGRTLLDRLDELMIAHGPSSSLQWSVVMPGQSGMARIQAAMTALREEPPRELDGSPVVRVVDLERGVAEERGERQEVRLPRSDVLAFYAEDGTRLIARPSGTEPKIKLYLEMTGRAASRDALAAERARLQEKGARIRAAVMARLGL